jgi:hypothetical protein
MRVLDEGSWIWRQSALKLALALERKDVWQAIIWFVVHTLLSYSQKLGYKFVSFAPRCTGCFHTDAERSNESTLTMRQIHLEVSTS